MSGIKSILTDDLDHCLICGSPHVEIHHCIFGTANRKVADRYGLVIALCREHHTGGLDSVHRDAGLDLQIKRIAQEAFEKKYSHDKFVEIFGKNYKEEL